jgi:hypothetical protein
VVATTAYFLPHQHQPRTYFFLAQVLQRRVTGITLVTIFILLAVVVAVVGHALLVHPINRVALVAAALDTVG